MPFLTGAYLEAVEALSKATFASAENRDGMLIDATVQVPDEFELVRAEDTGDRIEVVLRQTPHVDQIGRMDAIGAYIERLRYEHTLVTRDGDGAYLVATAARSGLGQLLLIRVLPSDDRDDAPPPSLRLV